MKLNLRYLPKRLSRKDKKSQSKMLMKSRRLYKKGVYYTRKAVPSFKSTKSKKPAIAISLLGVLIHLGQVIPSAM